MDFYRIRFCEWQHALSLNNGIVDHAADQRNYREAANELYARERRRRDVGGSVEWKNFIASSYDECVDRDRMYQWLAKHAQRAAIFDRRTLNPPSSVDTSVNSSWQLVANGDESVVGVSVPNQPSPPSSTSASALPHGTAGITGNVPDPSQGPNASESPVDDTHSLDLSVSSIPDRSTPLYTAKDGPDCSTPAPASSKPTLPQSTVHYSLDGSDSALPYGTAQASGVVVPGDSDAAELVSQILAKYEQKVRLPRPAPTQAECDAWRLKAELHLCAHSTNPDLVREWWRNIFRTSECCFIG